MRRRNKSEKESNRKARCSMAVFLAVLLAAAMLLGQPFVSVRTYAADEADTGENYTEEIRAGEADTTGDDVVTDPDAEQPEEAEPADGDVNDPDAEQPEEAEPADGGVNDPDAEQPEEVKPADGGENKSDAKQPEKAESSETKRNRKSTVSEFKVSAQWIGLDETAQEFIDSNNMHAGISITIEGYENTYTQPIIVKSASSGGRSYSYYGYTYVDLMNKDDYVIYEARSSIDEETFSNLKITISEQSGGPGGYYFNNGFGVITINGKMYVFNPKKNEIKVNTTPAETQDIVLKNEIAGYSNIIQKRLKGTDVPAGKVLTWRVERFTGGEWKPAADVEYQLDSITQGMYLDYGYYTEGPIPIEHAFGKTGEDGVIKITTSELFYACNIIKVPGPPSGELASLYVSSSLQVAFRDRVLVNAQSGQEGDLRVVEVEEESDEEWGHLNAYITSIWNNNYYWEYPGYSSQKDAGPDQAKGFLNSNKKTAFRVEKVVLDPEDTEKTDPDDDTEFTFTLEQFEDPDDESSLIPGAGIPFTVYDKESGEEISQGITDENGTFTLKGGQYALFEVREETKWKVTEEEPQEYHVKKLDICGEVSDDDPGNSAVLDLRTPDPTTDPVRCQTLKGYMTPYLDTLMRMHDTNLGISAIQNIYFGKTSDFDSSITDTDKYVVVDDLETGSIKAYAVLDESGYYTYADVYILSDDLMYTNPSCNSMFSGTYQLIKVSFSNVDFSLTKNMDQMFYYCQYLQTVEGPSNWNTSSLTSAKGMFGYCHRLLNLEPVTRMDTSKVEDISNMFSRCYNLQSLDLSNWDVSQVKNMDYLFQNCARINNLNVSNWNTSNVTSMVGTFYLDNNYYSGDLLKELDLTGWDTSNVTDMQYMFRYDKSLEKIYVGDKWNVSGVESSSEMFFGCSNLPNYDSSVTDKTRAYVGGDGYLSSK